MGDVTFAVVLSGWEQSLLVAKGGQNGRTPEDQLSAMIHRELNRMTRMSVPDEIFRNPIVVDIKDRRKASEPQ